MDPDPFLNELTKFYENQREKGTVWVTMKRGMCAFQSTRSLMHIVFKKLVNISNKLISQEYYGHMPVCVCIHIHIYVCVCVCVLG